MTDQEIIQGLIDRNVRITQDFFFRRCQPLIFALISKFYPNGADYDELVNEGNLASKYYVNGSPGKPQLEAWIGGSIREIIKAFPAFAYIKKKA